MTTIIELIKSNFDALEQQYREKIIELENLAANQNQDIPPNIDNLGKHHAPFDGYLFDDNVYSKGQFIPLMTVEAKQELADYMLEFHGKVIGTQDAEKFWPFEKIKVSKSIADELTQYSDELWNKYRFKLSSGKCWDELGDDVCFVYLKARRKSLVSIAASFVKKFNKSFEKAHQEKREEILTNVPNEKTTVRGKVSSLKVVEDFYGTSFKMLVDCGRFKIYGTAPSAILDDLEVGHEIEFTATLQAKELGFGFFKRPSKSRILLK